MISTTLDISQKHEHIIGMNIQLKVEHTQMNALMFRWIKIISSGPLLVVVLLVVSQKHMRRTVSVTMATSSTVHLNNIEFAKNYPR